MEVSPCGTFIDKNARDRTIILDTRRPAAVITVSARNEETVNLIFASNDSPGPGIYSFVTT